VSATRDNQPSHDNGGESTITNPAAQQPNHAPQNKLRKFWQLMIDIGPALTVLALFLSIFQLIQASCGARDIRQIANSVSTRYEDVFPNNMPEIIELINRTEHSLTIITDVAAYGHYSSPPNSARYIQALESVNYPDRNIRIEILCYDSETAHKKLADQFAITDFEVYKSKKENQETLMTYAKWHNGKVLQNAGEIYDAIIQADDALLISLKSNAVTRVKTTSNDLPIFMWIRDDKEAIFSLHNYGQSPREDSFRTTDERFIARLKAIAKAEFEEPKQISSPPPVTTPPGSAPAQPSPKPSTSAVRSPVP
jgi:hypothetical protein